MTKKILTPEQLKFWDENGFVHLKGHYAESRRAELKSWVELLEGLPETPGKWMKYFEKDAAGNRLLCRVEDFIPHHAGLAELIRGKETLDLVGELMGERALLFKEKINFKLPGGKGFAPHQDAPAFTTFNQKYHITLMISVDPTTIDNGCLEVVRGRHKEGTMAQEKDGSLSAKVVGELRWEPVTTEPGDVLLFDSYIPHRSGPNRTQKPRRAFYVTYNRASEGDRRDDYYKDKRDKFPPDSDRIPGKDYSAGAALYNLANPIDK
ncbi:MAG: phytanoyl-CoA dioxygenase family protein [Deltaproteobacteria bacterium]|nr:phytanoyl-CoA dioxygenase family protein [Deltaproteobacteria bacterium]